MRASTLKLSDFLACVNRRSFHLFFRLLLDLLPHHQRRLKGQFAQAGDEDVDVLFGKRQSEIAFVHIWRFRLVSRDPRPAAVEIQLVVGGIHHNGGRARLRRRRARGRASAGRDVQETVRCGGGKSGCTNN